MLWALNILALLVAIIHIYFFYLESWAWGKPRTNQIFGQTADDAEKMRLMAFNQGFYNLFLAVAILIGLSWGPMPQGRTLIDYAVASALGAGLVLFKSSPRLWRGAVIQAGIPAVYLALRFLFL